MDAKALKARLVVDKILQDLRGRGGLDNAWDSIDDDIQQEIRDTWTDILLTADGGR